ncbi:MAG: HdeD family acid-resistance protein [Planctomycetes bacterium]|nr:HdeD family acid-resistance protein [Planctomycetota bacterium]
MSSSLSPLPQAPARGDLQDLRSSWGWLLALGSALIVVGMMAIGSAFIATLATVIVFAVLLLVGGATQLISALCARRWRGFGLHLLAGIVYLVVGVLMFDHPFEFAAGITIVIAAGFLVGGLFRIIAAVAERFHGWVWVLLNGVVTLVLGVMIWRRWPESSLWVIGLFVGIDMIFAGWSWVMLAVALRGLPKSA